MLIIGIILLFVGTSVFPQVFSSENDEIFNFLIFENYNDCDWVVDDEGDGDVHTIQSAIDSAIAGDTICVYSGTYIENIVIDKPIIKGIDEELGVGEDMDKPVIDGSGNVNKDTVIFKEGSADGAQLSGFEIIKGGESDFYNYYAGIMVDSNNNIISNNSINRNSNFGICLRKSSNSTLFNNKFNSNGWGGLVIEPESSYITFYNNTFENEGLMIWPIHREVFFYN